MSASHRRRFRGMLTSCRTPGIIKTRKNACLASALFQCSLIRSDAAATDHKATLALPMKNARRVAAAGHKTTKCRRQPPVHRCTAPLQLAEVRGVGEMTQMRTQMCQHKSFEHLGDSCVLMCYPVLTSMTEVCRGSCTQSFVGSMCRKEFSTNSLS